MYMFAHFSTQFFVHTMYPQKMNKQTKIVNHKTKSVAITQNAVFKGNEKKNKIVK